MRAGKDSPALRPLVADVERWARDNAEVAKIKEVSNTFIAGDWIVELDLYSGSNTEPPTDAIGVAQMGGGFIAPHKDLRDALYEKARKYGSLDKPYLIAVADGKDQLFSKDSIHSALTEAVFGDEIVQSKGGTTHYHPCEERILAWTEGSTESARELRKGNRTTFRYRAA